MRVLHSLPIGSMEFGVGVFLGLITAVLSYIGTGDADLATASGIAVAVKVSLAIWLSLFLSLKLLAFISARLSAMKARSEKIGKHGGQLKPALSMKLYQIIGEATIFSIYAMPVALVVFIWAGLGLLVHLGNVVNPPVDWSIQYWLGLFSASLISLFAISISIGLFILWTERRLHALESRPERALFRTTSFVSRLARVELST